MTITLHVGAHKTATSSIQITLRQNTEQLTSSGFQFPDIPDRAGRRKDSHGDAFRCAFQNSVSENPALRRYGYTIENDGPYFRNAIRQAVEDPRQTLFSAEQMTTFNEDEVERMRDFLVDLDRDIEVMCLIRSPSEMLVSSIQEGAKYGTEPTVKAVRKCRRILFYRKYFDRLRAFPFATAREHPLGPVGFFIDEAGLGDPADFRIAQVNESLGDLAVRLIWFINACLPLDKDSMSTGARSFADVKPLWQIPGARFNLTIAEAEAVRDGISRENRDLAEAFGPAFCDRSKARYAAAASRWTHEALDALIDGIGDLPAILLPAVFIYFELYGGISPDLHERFLSEARVGDPDEVQIRRGFDLIGPRLAHASARLALSGPDSALRCAPDAASARAMTHLLPRATASAARR